jgi:hypothetical protein
MQSLVTVVPLLCVILNKNIVMPTNVSIYLFVQDAETSSA